jgi:hypothetical protein
MLDFSKKMKYINTYMEPHLGDNVYHLDYLRKVVDLDSSYHFTHYAREQYLNELQTHLVGYENNIVLKSYNKGIPSDAIHGWINTDNWFEGDYRPEAFKLEGCPIAYDKMYIKWYDHLEEKYNIPNPIKTSEDFKTKFNGLEIYDLEKEYDVLLINSIPQSGQYMYEPDLFKQLALDFQDKGYKIITTNKIYLDFNPETNSLDSIECTLDYNYGLTHIAKLSTKTPIIIAVHTGPLALCLNKYSLENASIFHILDNRHSFSFDKITCSSTLTALQF